VKKLEKVIRKNRFVYTLVKRAGKLAIYSQADKDGTVTAYEVFKIKKSYAGIAPNGTVLPEREKFPSNEDFGRSAWSVPTLALAQGILAKLEADETPFVQSLAQVKKTHTKTVKAPKQSTSSAQIKKVAGGFTVRWYGKYKIVINGPDYKPVAPKPFLMKLLGCEGSIEQLCTKLFAK
jgi:hypothetical protein